MDVAGVFKGTVTGWRGTNPETRDTKRARKMKLDLAIVLIFPCFEKECDSEVKLRRKWDFIGSQNTHTDADPCRVFWSVSEVGRQMLPGTGVYVTRHLNFSHFFGRGIAAVQ